MISLQAMRLLQDISERLGVSYYDLFRLINFESGFNPFAKNQFSSARGLIQFVDSTARDLGFNNSLELVTTCPTVESQLPLVESYLSKFKPFRDKQSLYMSVFYPEYRLLPPETVFPSFVREINPGIDTISDYVKMVDNSGTSKKKRFFQGCSLQR